VLLGTEAGGGVAAVVGGVGVGVQLLVAREAGALPAAGAVVAPGGGAGGAREGVRSRRRSRRRRRRRRRRMNRRTWSEEAIIPQHY